MDVNLNDLIECMQLNTEEMSHYYNKKTGIIIYIQDESVSEYNKNDIDIIENYEEFEQEIIKNIYDFSINKSDYIMIPELNQDTILEEMKKFTISHGLLTIDSLNNSNTIESLRNLIYSNNLIEDWYIQLEEIEFNIAKKWCVNNNIRFY